MGDAFSERELKLTAALYAQRSGVVEHVEQTGRLPESIPPGGMHIAMRLLIRERGADITLALPEQLVYDAIVGEGSLPGGGARLVPGPGEGRNQ